MKSQAKSFNDFKLIVDAGTVTISRRFPNWNKNVTSGPSILATVEIKQMKFTHQFSSRIFFFSFSYNNLQQKYWEYEWCSLKWSQCRVYWWWAINWTNNNRESNTFVQLNVCRLSTTLFTESIHTELENLLLSRDICIRFVNSKFILNFDLLPIQWPITNSIKFTEKKSLTK